MQLEGYDNLAVLSQVGMATVYRAQQQSSERTVAIKFLSAGYQLDEQENQLFIRESLVISRLDHPNIVRIIDHGMSGERPYFIMDYVEGRTLSALGAADEVSLADGIHMMLQISRGLAYAHRNGVVHRDLNPDNILVDDKGHVYIVDFGLAWLESYGQGDADTIIGAADYLSPEHLNDPQHIGPLSDLYSLGALMYEFFTRKKPGLRGEKTGAALAGFPQPLADLISQCLQTEPRRRPRSAGEVSQRLLRLLKGTHVLPIERAEANAALGPLAESFELLDVITHNQYGSLYLFSEKDSDGLMVAKKRMGTHAGLRQAQQLKAIAYKHIVQILGVSSKRDTFIVVMEYLSGGSLKDRLARAWTLEAFLPVALDVSYAMHKAHEEGIVHGNLRPSNILFDEHGQVRVSDFGYSKHYIGNDKRDWYQPQSRLDASIQRDIYSAGIIFHHMLTGVMPQVSFGLLVREGHFESLAAPLPALLRGMIEMQSSNRFTSFREVIDVLNDLRLGVKPRAPSLKPADAEGMRPLWYALAVVAAAIGAYFLMA